MCRAATRCTGSASSGISTALFVKCCRNRTAPGPPHRAVAGRRGELLAELLRRAKLRGPRRPPSPSRAPPRPRRGARRAPRPAARPPPPRPARGPSASSVPTPLSGRPRLSPSALAVAMPMRRPVKDPGPTPPRSARRRPSRPPRRRALYLAEQRRGVLRPPFSERPSSASCSASPPRTAATAVSPVAVSKPTTAGSGLLAVALMAALGDEEVERADPLAAPRTR